MMIGIFTEAAGVVPTIVTVLHCEFVSVRTYSTCLKANSPGAKGKISSEVGRFSCSFNLSTSQFT